MFFRRPRIVPAERSLASSSRERGGGTLIVPSTAVLQQLLDEYGLKHTIDDDGDLTVRWEKCSLYFFHYGDSHEVLQARMYLNRRFTVEMRPSIALMLDDWNRTKLFPKTYTVLPDDGMVLNCDVAAEIKFCPAIESWSSTGTLPRNSSMPSVTEL